MSSLTTLSDNLDNLSPKDRGFAVSMLDQAQKGRALSDKQNYWVEKLIAMATGTAPAPVVQTVGDVSGILALFAKAGEKLKYPKIRLALDDGRPVALTVAGANSKNPGAINVTDGGRYGDNLFYGVISTAGVFKAGNRTVGDTATSVVALLAALAADPAGVGSKYGKLTGCCSFCTTPLTDQRSLDVGYGPICAKTWNLPWGEK